MLFRSENHPQGPSRRVSNAERSAAAPHWPRQGKGAASTTCCLSPALKGSAGPPRLFGTDRARSLRLGIFTTAGPTARTGSRNKEDFGADAFCLQVLQWHRGSLPSDYFRKRQERVYARHGHEWRYARLRTALGWLDLVGTRDAWKRVLSS